MSKKHTTHRRAKSKINGGTMQLKALGAVLLVAAMAGLAITQISGTPFSVSASTPAFPSQGLNPGSQTLMTDGRILDISDNGARIFGDVQARQAKPLSVLTHRRFHTATAMPDGRVLIWGGIDRAGQSVASAEWFDPTTTTFSKVEGLSLTSRAGHTATVLTDGRVLFAGGWNEQYGLLTQAELLDPMTGKVMSLQAPTRVGATATLMPDGRVAFQGGSDGPSQRAKQDFVFDPHANRFDIVAPGTLLALLQPPAAAGPRILESLPGSGEQSVSVNRPLVVRFSQPMDPSTLNEKTLALLGPQGNVDVKVHIAEGGRLAFVQPTVDLLPASFYALYVNGVKSSMEEKLPLAAISFDTTALPGSSSVALAPTTDMAHLIPPSSDLTAVAMNTDNVATTRAKTVGATFTPSREMGYVEDGTWYPGRNALNGQWRIGRDRPPMPDLSAVHTKVATGTTAVFGQILQVDDRPVAGVEVTVGGKSARTDGQGLFLLTGVPAGRQELFVDGSTAGKAAFEYGQLVIGIDVHRGQVTSLDQQVFLPKINPRDRVVIASPTTKEVVVTHPDMPGLEIRIPAGAVLRDHKGRIIHDVALVPTPLDRAPYPTPAGFPSYFTLQPGGAMVLGITSESARGIRVVYPNYTHAAPGTKTTFVAYDPQQGWKNYGHGQVSADGRQVIPDAGVALYVEVGAGYCLGNTSPGRCTNPPPPPSPPPPSCPPPGVQMCCCDSGCGSGGGSGASPGSQHGGGAPAASGDPVDLSTGLFQLARTDLVIDDVMPLMVRRVYRQGDTVSRAFGYGTNFDYGIYLYDPDGTDNTPELVLPSGAVIVFNRVSGSGAYGSWRHTTSASSVFYGATLTSGGSAPESYVITLKDGTQYTFSPITANYLTAIRDRYGNTVTLNYSGVVNGQGILSKVVSASGRYLSFTYDGNNRIHLITDHTGRTVQYDYTATGYLQKVTYPDQTYEYYAYDLATSIMQTVQDRNGNIIVTNNQFDAAGRIKKQTLADNTTYTFTYTTDGSGKVTAADAAIFDPVNAMTVTRHVVIDSRGYPTSDTWGYNQSDAQNYSFARDPNTEQVQVKTDPNGRKTHYSYDATGNISQVDLMYQTSEQVSYQYTYTPDYNQIQTITDPLNHTTTYGYTGGCLTSIKDALNHTWSFTCNGSGQRTSVKDPLLHVTNYGYLGYDLWTVADALGHTTTTYRDNLGRVISTYDPLGNLSQATYDTNDRVRTTTDPMGAVTQYWHDNNGNLTRVIDPNAGYVQYGYDKRDRMTSYTDALFHGEIWNYDGFGNWVTHRDRNGNTTSQKPDDLGRFNLVTYSDSSTLQYSFDLANRLTKVTDSVPGGTVILTPDDFDRLNIQTSSVGTVTYTYDDASRRKYMQITGQPRATYTFDNADRFTQITLNGETAKIGYDNANRLQTVTLPNGVVTTYGFDNADRLTSLVYKNSAGTQLGDLAYSPDDAGRIASITGSWSSDQLPATTSGDYAYNAGNRLGASNGYTPQYDNQGQMLQDGKGNTYTWNVRHQLTDISQGVQTIAHFDYDALGRRVGKTVSSGTTKYLYDGNNSIQEVQGSTINNLLTGIGIDQRFARSDTPGRMYYLTDMLGSTVALTDGTAVVQQRYAYDLYGTAAKLMSTSVTNPYTYTGREDDGTGLYYYRARYYNPKLARFISEDPIGLVGGANVYAYVSGNPISLSDPSGLAGQSGGLPAPPSSAAPPPPAPVPPNLVPQVWPLPPMTPTQCRVTCISIHSTCQANADQQIVDDLQSCKTKTSRSPAANCMIGALSVNIGLQNWCNADLSKCIKVCGK